MIAKRSMVAAALLLAVLPLPARAQRAVYLVRHADKANNDPDTNGTSLSVTCFPALR